MWPPLSVDSVYAINSDYFKKNVPDSLLGLLITKGVLVTDAQGKKTRQITFSGKRLKRRYCLRSEKITDIEGLA